MQICTTFTSKQWKELRPRLDRVPHQQAWKEAIGVIRCRLEERFFKPIELLLTADEQAVVAGFSVMALCCLLAETLQVFYEGRTADTAQTASDRCKYPDEGCVLSPSTARSLKDFLTKSPYFQGDFPTKKIAGDFSVNVRNALLHDAETREGWLIRRLHPTEQNKIVGQHNSAHVVYRTAFYRALRKEFDDYLGRLADASHDELRRNFLRKMDFIANTAPQAE
jgi:hypothetical protein